MTAAGPGGAPGRPRRAHHVPDDGDGACEEVGGGEALVGHLRRRGRSGRGIAVFGGYDPQRALVVASVVVVRDPDGDPAGAQDSDGGTKVVPLCCVAVGEHI